MFELNKEAKQRSNLQKKKKDYYGERVKKNLFSMLRFVYHDKEILGSVWGFSLYFFKIFNTLEEKGHYWLCIILASNKWNVRLNFSLARVGSNQLAEVRSVSLSCWTFSLKGKKNLKTERKIVWKLKVWHFVPQVTASLISFYFIFIFNTIFNLAPIFLEIAFTDCCVLFFEVVHFFKFPVAWNAFCFLGRKWEYC